MSKSQDWLEVVQENHGDIEMNTVEEKEIQRCVKAKKRGAVAGVASSKQDIQPSVKLENPPPSAVVMS